MRKTTLLLTFFCLIQGLFAQKYMNKRNIQLGTSLTYIPGSKDDPNIYGNGEQHLNWSFNVTTSLTKRIQVGVENMMIFNSEINKPNLVRSNIFGGIVQYSLWSSKKENFFIEASIHEGNFCSCWPSFFYKTDQKLWYYGFGFGGNIYLKKGFFLDLGFNNYKIFNNIPEKSNSTRYVIGINYLINFKEKTTLLGS
jgi:hypothetical protein